MEKKVIFDGVLAGLEVVRTFAGDWNNIDPKRQEEMLIEDDKICARVGGAPGIHEIVYEDGTSEGEDCMFDWDEYEKKLQH